MVIRHRYTIGGALRGTARHQIRLELKEYGRRTDGHEGNLTPVRKRPFFDPSSDLTSFISLNVSDTSVGPEAWMGIRSMTRGGQLVVLKKGDPWLLLAVALSPFYSLLVILNLLNKNDLLRLKWRISCNMSERV